MSVNFNPSVSINPAPRVDLKKPNNTYEGKNPAQIVLEKNTEKVFEPNNGASRAMVALDPNIITAAELIARTNIIMAQEYDIPTEITASMNTADMHCEKALKLENHIKYKVQKIEEYFEKGESAPVSEIGEKRILTEEDGTIMLEYTPNGELLRKSAFKDGSLQKVEEFRPDGKKNVIIMNQGEVSEYMEGLEETEEGQTMERYFTFKDGEKFMYFEDYAEFNDGSSGASKWVWFQNDKMCAYYENMENTSQGSSTIGLHLRYDDNGVLYEYARDIEDGITLGKHFMFKDGKWAEKEK